MFADLVIHHPQQAEMVVGDYLWLCGWTCHAAFAELLTDHLQQVVCPLSFACGRSLLNRKFNRCLHVSCTNFLSGGSAV